MIEVKQTGDGDPLPFEVVIRDARGTGRYAVTMSRHDHERLTGNDVPPAEVVEAAFRFLLDREPRDAILPQFDLSVISRYFPEFEDRLPDYLAGSNRIGDGT